MKKTKNRTIANSTLWFVLLIGVGCAGCGNKKKISTVKLSDNQPLPGSTGHSIPESTVGESNDLLPSSQGHQAAAPSNEVSEAPTQDADHQPAQSNKSKGGAGKKKQSAKKAPKKDNKKTPPNLDQTPAPKPKMPVGVNEDSVEYFQAKCTELAGLIEQIDKMKNLPANINVSRSGFKEEPTKNIIVGAEDFLRDKGGPILLYDIEKYHVLKDREELIERRLKEVKIRIGKMKLIFKQYGAVHRG